MKNDRSSKPPRKTAGPRTRTSAAPARKPRSYGDAPPPRRAPVRDRAATGDPYKAARRPTRTVDRDSAGEAAPRGERPPFKERAAYGERKPYGERKSFGERKPYGERTSFGDKKPYGERKPFGDKKPYGDRKPFAERKPYGERKSFGDKPAYGDRAGRGFTVTLDPDVAKVFRGDASVNKALRLVLQLMQVVEGPPPRAAADRPRGYQGSAEARGFERKPRVGDDDHEAAPEALDAVDDDDDEGLDAIDMNDDVVADGDDTQTEEAKR